MRAFGQGASPSTLTCATATDRKYLRYYQIHLSKLTRLWYQYCQIKYHAKRVSWCFDISVRGIVGFGTLSAVPVSSTRRAYLWRRPPGASSIRFAFIFQILQRYYRQWRHSAQKNNWTMCSGAHFSRQAVVRAPAFLSTASALKLSTIFLVVFRLRIIRSRQGHAYRAGFACPTMEDFTIYSSYAAEKAYLTIPWRLPVYWLPEQECLYYLQEQHLLPTIRFVPISLQAK